jgi:uncharacterized protein YggE
MEPTVTASGFGLVPTPADVVQVLLAVDVHGDDPAAVLAACSAGLAAMTSTLRGRGVAEESLRTEGLSVQPHWDAGQPSPEAARLWGHATLAVLLPFEDARGDLVPAAVAAAGRAARVESVTLAVREAGAAQARARELAFTDARARAEQYAALAGRQLGPALSVREGERVAPAAVFARAGATEGLPLSAGGFEVTATVTVTWALE